MTSLWDIMVTIGGRRILTNTLFELGKKDIGRDLNKIINASPDSFNEKLRSLEDKLKNFEGKEEEIITIDNEFFTAAFGRKYGNFAFRLRAYSPQLSFPRIKNSISSLKERLDRKEDLPLQLEQEWEPESDSSLYVWVPYEWPVQRVQVSSWLEAGLPYLLARTEKPYLKEFEIIRKRKGEVLRLEYEKRDFRKPTFYPFYDIEGNPEEGEIAESVIILIPQPTPSIIHLSHSSRIPFENIVLPLFYVYPYKQLLEAGLYEKSYNGKQFSRLLKRTMGIDELKIDALQLSLFDPLEDKYERWSRFIRTVYKEKIDRMKILPDYWWGFREWWESVPPLPPEEIKEIDKYMKRKSLKLSEEILSLVEKLYI